MNKIVAINERYKVEVNELNKSLYVKHLTINKETKKEGECWSLVGHYGIWSHLFNKILEDDIVKNLSTEEASDIKDLKNIILTAKDEIINLLKEKQ